MRYLLILLALTTCIASAHPPIKAELDALFSSKRVLLCEKSLRSAGFHFSPPRKFTHLIVATHKKFPGYIFKLYLDTQRPHKNTEESIFWAQRITGAEKIRTMMAEKGWETWFKVPKKWIYHLPENPSPPKEYWRKNTLLVEEDMQLMSDVQNRKMWRSDAITEERLSAFYTLLETLGLKDCAKPDNAPFSLDGRIAFIDTQTHGQWPVEWEKLTPFLSRPMQKHLAQHLLSH